MRITLLDQDYNSKYCQVEVAEDRLFRGDKIPDIQARRRQRDDLQVHQAITSGSKDWAGYIRNSLCLKLEAQWRKGWGH